MPPQSPEFTIPEAVAVPMLAVDSGGVVRGANSAFCRDSGLGAERVIGRPLAELCDGAAGGEPALQALAQAFSQRTSIDGVALELHQSAATRWPVREPTKRSTRD